MDFKEIKKLIEMVEEAKISHFSIEEDGKRIEISKELTAATLPTQVVLPQEAPVVAAAPAPAAEPAAAAPAADAGLVPITAQMVGTFYSASSPDAAPFVKKGDSISNGQVICIIEAMKLFNEIESEVSGTIEEICVENGSPVEFGQTLFKVRP